MTGPPAHKWAFAARFRRHAFGWRSQPAVQRVREATAEIRKVAKKDPALAAAGAVLFLEKVSPALEHVDGSSGAIGTAINHAIEVCAKIIAEAPVDDETRDRWLDRLWAAHQNEEIPYIDRLTDYWGELCASRDRASAWADRLIDTVEMAWTPHQKPGGYFQRTIACLSALFHSRITRCSHENIAAVSVPEQRSSPALRAMRHLIFGETATFAVQQRSERGVPGTAPLLCRLPGGGSSNLPS